MKTLSEIPPRCDKCDKHVKIKRSYPGNRPILHCLKCGYTAYQYPAFDPLNELPANILNTATKGGVV